MKTFLTFIAFILIGFIQTFARDSKTEVFKLKKQDGHYFFQAKINQSVKGRILMESGIHAMLIDSAFAFKHQEALGLDFMPNQIEQNMNLGGRRYRITHKAQGKIMLNDMTSYEGELLVLAGYASFNDIAVPIQNLRNTIDNSRIVKLDMKKYMLQLISKSEYLSKYQRSKPFEINYDTYLNMPAVKAQLAFEQNGRSYTLSGNFVLDLGNGSFIALMKQSPLVKDFLKINSGLALRNGYDSKGTVVAEAVVAQRTELCGISFGNQIIVITSKLPKFTSEGNIGLKFFDNSVSVFNFDTSEFVIF